MKSIFLLPLLFVTCTLPVPNQLMGEWCLVTNCNSKLIFKADGTFELAINGSICNMGNEDLKYKVDRTKDGNWVQVSNKSNVIFVIFKYEINDCNLLVVYFKKGEKINHDIDEIGYYKKGNCITPLSIPAQTQTFVIPDNYLGDVYIIYSGEIESKEKFSRFNIPASGIFNIPFKAEPFDLLKGGLIFLSTKGDTLEQFTQGVEPSVNSKKNHNKQYVKIIGFNQTSREDLEAKFGINEKIRDVLKLKIAPYDELISKE